MRLSLLWWKETEEIDTIITGEKVVDKRIQLGDVSWEAAGRGEKRTGDRVGVAVDDVKERKKNDIGFFVVLIMKWREKD